MDELYLRVVHAIYRFLGVDEYAPLPWYLRWTYPPPELPGDEPCFTCGLPTRRLHTHYALWCPACRVTWARFEYVAL